MLNNIFLQNIKLKKVVIQKNIRIDNISDDYLIPFHHHAYPRWNKPTVILNFHQEMLHSTLCRLQVQNLNAN